MPTPSPLTTLSRHAGLRRSLPAALAALALASAPGAHAELAAGSLPSWNRDSEWRLSLGSLASVQGSVHETFRAYYAATGQSGKQALAESYDLDDFGVEAPYWTLGVHYGRQWDWLAFHWNLNVFNLSADATAKRNYYLGVGDDIRYHGRDYDHLKIPAGQRFSIDFAGGLSDLTLSVTPFSWIIDESIKVTPALDLGLVLVGGQYEIDAGRPRGTTVYQNPPVDFVVGGRSSSFIGAAAPMIGIGGEVRVIYANDVEWVTRGSFGVFSYDGSTKPFTSAGHREKDIDLTVVSALVESGFVFPLGEQQALTVGGRLQYFGVDAEVTSKEHDAAAVIAARERFDKSADIDLVILSVYLGLTY